MLAKQHITGKPVNLLHYFSDAQLNLLINLCITYLLKYGKMYILSAFMLHHI